MTAAKLTPTAPGADSVVGGAPREMGRRSARVQSLGGRAAHVFAVPPRSVLTPDVALSVLEGWPAVETFEQGAPATEAISHWRSVATYRRTAALTRLHSIYAGMSRTTSVNLPELIS